MSGTTQEPLKEMDLVLTETLSLSQDFLHDILLQISAIEPFNPDKEYYWNIQFSALSADITKFVELTTLLSKIVMAKSKQALNEIKDSQVHLLFILKSINQAQQKHDSLALEDLIKYELKDNLTQWKTELIPLIKRHLNA